MLIKCLECGGQVSDKALTCPHCGAPVESFPRVQHSDTTIQTIASDLAVTALERKIERGLSGNCSGEEIVGAWYEFENKVKPTQGQYVNLADRVALSAMKSVQGFLEFTGDIEKSVKIVGQACRIAKSDTVRQELDEMYHVLVERKRIAVKKFGEMFQGSLEALAHNSEFGVGNGEVIHKCCQTCKYSCYRKSFMIKTWLCSFGSFGKPITKKTKPTDVCKNYKYEYPFPETLSKKQLLRYGVVRYALSQGFSYVHSVNIMDFGRCKRCKHFQFRTHHMLAECRLRGVRGELYDDACCPSFSPFSPTDYIKIRD